MTSNKTIYAEKALCGALIQSPDATFRAAEEEGVNPELFLDYNCELVWRTASLIKGRGEHVDIISIVTSMGGDADKNMIFLEEMLQVCPTAAHAKYYAHIVAKEQAREKLRAASKMAAEALEKGGDIDAVAKNLLSAAKDQKVESRRKSSQENGKKGGRPAVTKEISDAYVSSCGVPFPLRRHRGAWYRHDGRAYRAYTVEDLHSSIMAFLRSYAPESATRNMVANVAANVSGGDLAGIESKYPMPCWLPSGTPASGWVSMKNAIVNANALAKVYAGIEQGESEIKRDHSVDFFSTFSLDYDYNPEATCHKWDSYLLGVQPDPEMREMLQMLMGLCLVPDTSYEVFFVLSGVGGGGKNVFLHTLENVVGASNICALPLSKFGEKHSAHMLTENLVNIVGDMPTSDSKTSLHAIEGILKDAVSGGLISCERKNQEPYQAHAIARCIFATNSLPNFADRSDGVWDRIRIVPFDVKFRGTEKQNPYLKEEIAASELPGVFNWAIRGLAKLRGLRSFPRGPRGREEESRHRSNCDHEAQFVKDRYIKINGSFVEGNTIYAEYRSFCEDNGYRPKNAANFANDLRRIIPGVVDDRRRIEGTLRRGYLNIGRELTVTDEEY